MQDQTAALLTGAARAGNEACIALLSTDRFLQEIDRYVLDILPYTKPIHMKRGSDDNSVSLSSQGSLLFYPS